MRPDERAVAGGVVLAYFRRGKRGSFLHFVDFSAIYITGRILENRSEIVPVPVLSTASDVVTTDDICH